MSNSSFFIFFKTAKGQLMLLPTLALVKDGCAVYLTLSFLNYGISVRLFECYDETPLELDDDDNHDA